MRNIIIASIIGALVVTVGVYRYRADAATPQPVTVYDADVDHDGSVTILDLTNVANHFLEAAPLPTDTPLATATLVDGCYLSSGGVLSACTATPTSTPTATPTATATPIPCAGAAVNAVWTAGNGHCYQRFDTTKNFEDARLDCESRGDHLVTMAGWLEQNFVWTAMGADDTYIGLTDELTELDFRWVTGEPVSFTWWDSGEPSQGFSDPEQDATVFVAARGGMWNDVSLVGIRRYVCESP